MYKRLIEGQIKKFEIPKSLKDFIISPVNNFFTRHF